jgi:CRP-like cAMP-binding protein
MNMRVTNPLTMKLSSFVDLSKDDRDHLNHLASFPSRMRSGRDIIREGERPESVILLLTGWAYRYKVLADGRRQIVAHLLPGDLCDTHVFILGRMDHSIGLLSDATVAAISRETIIEVTERAPTIARALWWSTLVDEAVLRHWLINIGQRDAYDRTAHLFCELWERAAQVGLVNGNAFDLPLTQEQLGDSLGLTAVHTNRVLQRMRGEGLITFQGKRLAILDMEGMRGAAAFDPSYLHLVRRNDKIGPL